ncbi:MAG: sugar transferase [Chloroflexota bacterium]|nr:MAG: sugar transferase [Chloroflexota bacterium]
MRTQTLVLKTHVSPTRLNRIRDRLLSYLSWIEGFNVLLAKRVIDLTLCLLLIAPALLVMAVIAFILYLDSSRPILFAQDRAGRGGRKFRIYKFRTLKREYCDLTDRECMKAYVRGLDIREPGSNEKQIHKPFDPTQVTRVGRFLRRTSLDELPQLWNVLRGEMSLVGPRPNVIWEVEAYSWWHTERLEALPGITGLAQVRGRSGIPFDQIARYDIEYVRKISLKLDLQIMWWTVASILKGTGAG